MKITKKQLRRLVRETFNPRSTLHPKYSPDYSGDEEASVKMDDLAKSDRSYTEELYDMHGVEKGSLQNPSRINMEKLSGISDEELNSFIYAGIEDTISASFYGNRFKAWITKWETIYEFYMQDDIMQELINEVIEVIVQESLADRPGIENLRRKHVVALTGDELTKQAMMKEIRDWHEQINTYGDPEL